VAPVMLQVALAQVCVPPVAGTVQVPIRVPVLLSRWMAMLPPAAVLATRAVKAEVQLPKARFRTLIQSVGAMSVTSLPPSEQA